MLSRTGWIGIGLAVGGLGAAGIATALHVRSIHAANTPDALAKLVMDRHDRDGTPGVKLTGPVTADDERWFPNAQTPNGAYYGSYLEVLAAADLVGNHDSIATRDEVAGLLAIGDLDHSGVLDTREQQNITHIAGYTNTNNEFFPHHPTIAEVPGDVMLATDPETLAAGANYANEQAPSFVEQLREPRMHQ